MDHKAAPKTLFIINPNAGERKVEKLLRQLKKYQSEISFRITEYPDHAKDIVSSEFGRYDTFVAVGGDGTVNEIASRLVGCNKKLAIYPTGSGNGFAREFGFEKNLNRLMDAIDRGEILKVDVVSLNGMRSFHFSGLGYDSAVAYDFSKRKGRGFWNYVASTVNVIAKYKPIEASVKIDKKIISGRFFMINIANNRQFGYHALIAPKANPTDGEINLVLVSPFKKILFPLFSMKLFLGILKPSKTIRTVISSSEIIITTSEQRIHIDGEPKEINSPINIEVEPACLNVVDTGRTKF